jgi:hypothetical protein
VSSDDAALAAKVNIGHSPKYLNALVALPQVRVRDAVVRVGEARQHCRRGHIGFA